MVVSDMETSCCLGPERNGVSSKFFINVIAGTLILTTVYSFKRINHRALKPFALILCLHVADHHVTNN